jgi:hypothetical protein
MPVRPIGLVDQVETGSSDIDKLRNHAQQFMDIAGVDRADAHLAASRPGFDNTAIARLLPSQSYIATSLSQIP